MGDRVWQALPDSLVKKYFKNCLPLEQQSAKKSQKMYVFV
jgi:hypothetical protein